LEAQEETMPIVIVSIGIAALLLLIMRFKLNVFAALILVSFAIASSGYPSTRS
jgi:H+/gluconate symporter-like permease